MSFGDENIDTIMTKYERLLDGPAANKIKNAHIAGVAFGYSICIRFIYVGIVFYIGAEFAEIYKLNFQYVFQSIYIIFTSAMGAGFAMSSVPSASQAKDSAQKIFKIIDE